jgi:hypothetical protein
MSILNQSPAELRQLSIDRLLVLLPKGATVYTTVTHVARSGMSRRMMICCGTTEPRKFDGAYHDLDQPHDGPAVRNIGWDVAHALGNVVRLNLDNHQLTVSGCGMDMGFHVVSSLSRVLYGDDYALCHRWL